DIVRDYGADTLRTYEMFIGAFDAAAAWSENGVKGCRRFLERVWKCAEMVTDETGISEELETKVHQTIKKVSQDFETLKYNTAIAAMMELVNEFYKKGCVTRDEFKTLLILLNPVAPHITEELWEQLGEKDHIYEQSWPEFDEEKTKESVIEIGVQVNGKVRGTVSLPVDADKDTALAAGREAVADKLEGKTIVKEIYVPGRILNIVVK
ncbi:MAG TPA: leucine--tRNA ligase, partial [Lachnospiraceae bacterium]|nr:leucine--tRNA ligase [Lachnospiraceae bacterium]